MRVDRMQDLHHGIELRVEVLVQEGFTDGRVSARKMVLQSCILFELNLDPCEDLEI